MVYSEPTRTAAHRTRPTLHRARRRLPLGKRAVLLLVLMALTGAGHLLSDRGRTLDGDGRARVMLGARLPPGDHRRPIAWPQRGQAAFVLGDGRPVASPHQQPAPIASLAKVMTAYLTLEHHPLNNEEQGFTITVTSAQAQAEAQDAAQGQSVVNVRAGEQLTERQLLEALLIPSGNNIARMLADVVAGSESGFLAEMNSRAAALAMDKTTYTDPSGFDPGTVSTAADQLRIFQRAMRFSVFRQIVATASVTLPVAGTLKSFNPLIAAGYAGKTGSDSAAGGCLAFFTRLRSKGRLLTAAGVVMGQGQGSETQAILAAAGEAAEELVDSVG